MSGASLTESRPLRTAMPRPGSGAHGSISPVGSLRFSRAPGSRRTRDPRRPWVLCRLPGRRAVGAILQNVF